MNKPLSIFTGLPSDRSASRLTLGKFKLKALTYIYIFGADVYTHVALKYPCNNFVVSNFQCNNADPPWTYSLRESDQTHRNRTPYPNMSDADILNLPVGEEQPYSGQVSCTSR
jgi:hypothetical protein